MHFWDTWFQHLSNSVSAMVRVKLPGLRQVPGKQSTPQTAIVEGASGRSTRWTACTLSSLVPLAGGAKAAHLIAWVEQRQHGGGQGFAGTQGDEGLLPRVHRYARMRLLYAAPSARPWPVDGCSQRQRIPACSRSETVEVCIDTGTPLRVAALGAQVGGKH